MQVVESSAAVAPVQVVANFSDIENPADVKALRKAANDFKSCLQKAQNKYWELCMVIRDRQIAPEVVTRELTELEFRPERISEIKKVCFAPATLFEEFRSRSIGFRLALQRARDDEPNGEQTDLPLPPGKHESPQQRFKRELTEFLELSVPVTGTLPKFLSYTVKGVANGHAFSLTVSKKKQAEKK